MLPSSANTQPYLVRTMYSEYRATRGNAGTTAVLQLLLLLLLLLPAVRNHIYAAAHKTLTQRLGVLNHGVYYVARLPPPVVYVSPNRGFVGDGLAVSLIVAISFGKVFVLIVDK